MNFKHWPKKIIHVDMDAFFAAVEIRDNPKLKGLPVIVGGSPQSRGVVSTCSYEARKFGVHSAMASAQAYRLCPQAVFLRPNFKKYSEASDTIHSIFHKYTGLVESVSLDEAYLDVTQNHFKMDDPVMAARLIKQHILAATKLTASAGVSINLFLAKIASDMDKPDGLTVIAPEDIEKLMPDLPVRKIPGVGPKTEKSLHEHGIKTCGDIQKMGLRKLTQFFGNSGPWLLARARGESEREVEPYHERKQISVENTFEKDIRDRSRLEKYLAEYAAEVFHDLVQSGKQGTTVTLKVKYHDFEQITRSKTLKTPLQSAVQIAEIACELLRTKTLAGSKPVRLIGVGISGFERNEKTKAAGDDRQMELF